MQQSRFVPINNGNIPIGMPSNILESANRYFYRVNANEINYSLQTYQTVTSIYLFLFSVVGCDQIVTIWNTWAALLSLSKIVKLARQLNERPRKTLDHAGDSQFSDAHIPKILLCIDYFDVFISFYRTDGLHCIIGCHLHIRHLRTMAGASIRAIHFKIVAVTRNADSLIRDSLFSPIRS